MDAEDEIKWVKLELNFSPEEEARLESCAQAEGLSLKCFCLRILLKELSDDPLENWETREAATLSRNSCQGKTANALPT